ncbi:MAG: 4'-phosphopantetheinyl transferase superfamily protein [Chloroflexi bacterium]|nr:4'-phosphopantetheinyl transferase superfamily protein [Chloroflexota bacterium]
MLFTLAQSSFAHPALALGLAPTGLLAPAEHTRLEGLRLVRRRREWLLGRWTAKHLVRHVLWRAQGEGPALSAIFIGNDERGAPYAARCVGQEARPERLPMSLSISHSEHIAFCAAWWGQSLRVGADVERIAPLDSAWMDAFLNERERVWLEKARSRAIPAHSSGAFGSDSEFAVWLTAIWSAKEAALKALRLGLRRADPRLVTCHLGSSVALIERWRAVRLTLAPELVPASSQVNAWWRFESPYVFAVVVV